MPNSQKDPKFNLLTKHGEVDEQVPEDDSVSSIPIEVGESENRSWRVVTRKQRRRI